MKPTQIPLIYCAYDGILSQSVFNSQVVEPLTQLYETQRIDPILIAFEGFIPFFSKFLKLHRKRKIIRQHHQFQVYFFPRLPGFWGLNITATLLKLFSLIIFRNGDRNQRVIFQGRGMKSAYLGIRLSRIYPQVKVIYDIRAKEPEQYIYPALAEERIRFDQLTPYQRTLYHRMQQIEQGVFEKADYFFAISTALKQTIPHPVRCEVIPNGFNPDRFYFSPELRTRMRRQLGLEQRFCFVFSGSVHQSQMLDTAILLFKKYLDRDPTACFLGLTLAPKKLRDRLAIHQIPASNYLVFKIPYHEMVDYLNVADIALLFREKNIYNRTSFPVKFAEYLACGIYTIVSDEIADITPVVQQYRLGEVVAETSEPALTHLAEIILQKRTELQSPELKQHITDIASQLYNQSELTRKRIAIYEQLVNGSFPSRTPQK